MNTLRSFFTYSPKTSKSSTQKVHVLFHKYKTRWLALNDTGLEIAGLLDQGYSADDIVRHLRSTYGVTSDQASKDVSYVSRQLARQEIFIGRKAEQPKRIPSLKSIFFHLTDRCNLKCAHCYLSCPDHHEVSELPTGVVLRLIDELTHHNGRAVVLSGGEPLLHSGIKQILTSAAPKLQIRLLTNGTLIDKEWAAFLTDLDIYIQVSLDGSTREIHDAIRGNGAFDKALKALEYLQHAGLRNKINIAATVMNQNIHDLPEIISLAERLDVPGVRFLPLRDMGTAKTSWQSIGAGVSVADQEDFYMYATALQVTKKTSVEISCGLSGFLLKMPEAFSEDDIWCSLGNRIVVTVNGDAFPCALMMKDEFKLGNILSDSTEKIMQSRPMATVCRALTDRRKKIEKCAACDWRNFCQSGCMGQALDEKGTIWETDDFCGYRKKAYQAAFDGIIDKFNRQNNS